MHYQKKLSRPLLLSGNDRRIEFSYNGLVDTVSRDEFASACSQQGIDIEIALLRVIIKRLLKNDPANLPALLQALQVLALLIEVRNRIPDDNDCLEDTVHDVIRDLAVDFGLDQSSSSGPAGVIPSV